jgi:tetratricopeptide (TPR) repeat protein
MKIRSHIPLWGLALLALSTLAASGQTSTTTPSKFANQTPRTLSAQEIFKGVSPSVMVVESLDGEGSAVAFGSGVVIAPGRVITNRHLIEDGASFRLEHGGAKWPAKLVSVAPDHDLAELSVAGLVAPAVVVRDSSSLAVGERVYAIGAPEGLELTISEGLISGLRDFDNARVIQTSAAISPGSSGGGLFDSEGRLVGITTFYLEEGQSLNFALPAEWTLALDRQPENPSPPTNQDSAEFQALVWCEIGYQAALANEFRAAARAFHKAVEMKPDLAAAWAGMGVVYVSLGQFGKAVSAGREAVRLAPQDARAWLALGDGYGGLGDYEKQLKAFQEAIRAEPGFELAWQLLGSAYGALGQPEQEVSAEQQALRLKPDDELAWLRLADAYASLREYGKAVSASREAVRLKPDDADGWFSLGLYYGFLGQRTKALDVYQRLKALDPKLADRFFNEVVLP